MIDQIINTGLNWFYGWGGDFGTVLFFSLCGVGGWLLLVGGLRLLAIWNPFAESEEMNTQNNTQSAAEILRIQRMLDAAPSPHRQPTYEQALEASRRLQEIDRLSDQYHARYMRDAEKVHEQQTKESVGTCCVTFVLAVIFVSLLIYGFIYFG